MTEGAKKESRYLNCVVVECFGTHSSRLKIAITAYILSEASRTLSNTSRCCLAIEPDIKMEAISPGAT